MDPGLIWKEYREGKQTYSQLAKKYKCSIRTIQRKIDLYKSSYKIKIPREVIVLMDTTYWGRNFGVMLFKDAIFVSHQVYPWQVALQQSLLLFNLTKQKYHDMFDYKKTAKKKCNHFVHLRTTTQKKQPFCLLYQKQKYNMKGKP